MFRVCFQEKDRSFVRLILALFIPLRSVHSEYHLDEIESPSVEAKLIPAIEKDDSSSSDSSFSDSNEKEYQSEVNQVDI